MELAKASIASSKCRTEDPNNKEKGAEKGKGAKGKKKKLTELDKAEAVLAEAQMELLREETAEKSLQGMGYDWYPDYWMAFIMFGRPAEAEKRMLTSLNGGIPSFTIDPSTSTDVVGSPTARIANAGRLAGRKANAAAAAVKRTLVADTEGMSTVTAAP